MEKVTKKELIERINEQELRIYRIEKALKQSGIKWVTDELKLKQLDQSVFDGLDAKWRFAAVDKCGEVWCSTHKTQPSTSGTHLSHELKADSVQVNGYYDTSDWQNSLIERKELTGSDLCRAMLGNGFEYVMCLVSDECEDSASNSEVVRVVCSRGADYFDDTTEDMWYFAIPINNQGEPLTATDVGL